MEKEKLTKNEIVIRQLMKGEVLTSKDIAEKASYENELDLDKNEVSTILNRLNNTDLGHFIKKQRKGRAFEYQMVDEIKDMLTPKQAYGLSLKIGKDRYPLEDALEEYPALRKYVKKPRRKKNVKSRQTASVINSPETSPRRMGETLTFSSGMDLGSVENLLQDLLKMISTDKEINVNVDVRVRLEN